jgi:putative membrane protein
MFGILVVGILLFLVAAGLPGADVLAHDGAPHGAAGIWSAWNWDPLILLSLTLPGWLYLRGVRFLWRKAGKGRGVGVRHILAFSTGLLALFAALISPLDTLAAALLSGHMVQHLLLIMVAAPLLVLGAPPAAQIWSIPASWRVDLSRWWRRQSGLKAAWSGISNPWVAWLAHALAITAWHIPRFYEAALLNDFIHLLEHASFFLTALLYWRAVFRSGAHGQLNHGASMLYVFSMMMYQGVLGALITFSRSPWYPIYEESAAAWGLTLLEDQQLAGSIMWVPGNFVFLVVFIWLLWQWFQAMERRQLAAHNPSAADRRGPGGINTPGAGMLRVPRGIDLKGDKQT